MGTDKVSDEDRMEDGTDHMPLRAICRQDARATRSGDSRHCCFLWACILRSKDYLREGLRKDLMTCVSMYAETRSILFLPAVGSGWSFVGARGLRCRGRRHEG